MIGNFWSHCLQIWTYLRQIITFWKIVTFDNSSNSSFNHISIIKMQFLAKKSLRFYYLTALHICLNLPLKFELVKLVKYSYYSVGLRRKNFFKFGLPVTIVMVSKFYKSLSVSYQKLALELWITSVIYTYYWLHFYVNSYSDLFKISTWKVYWCQ